MQYIINTDKYIAVNVNVFFAEYPVLRNFLFYFLFVNFDPQKKITTEVMILKTKS